MLCFKLRAVDLLNALWVFEGEFELGAKFQLFEFGHAIVDAALRYTIQRIRGRLQFLRCR